MKVDEGLAWYFNDEYVHAPGHPYYYESYSESIERYSFWWENGKYSSLEDEATARFPLADPTGEVGAGYPYSVFMPVDNLGRYWYNSFLRSGDTADLGSVMHAIQDASIPHHAAGTHGNWHGDYEAYLNTHIVSWTQKNINNVRENAYSLFS